MQFDIRVFLKGMLMGAADIVPGVSGGTIAFITGIYERLIFALKEVLPAFWQLLKDRKLAVFWHRVDAFFLLTLFLGIVSSVALFAKLISYLLVFQPVLIWSFFFGLIVASVWVVGRQISQWGVTRFMCLVAGLVIAWGVTAVAPIQLTPGYEVAFISGAIAICAMILPGISGSFILVILGTYAFILEALKSLDLIVVGLFMLGCVVGLLSIANVLAWAFKRFEDITLALLTGFMIGALNKVWPWKEVLSYRVNSKGEQVPLLEQSVMPSYYEEVLGLPSQTYIAFGMALLAMILVIGISSMAPKNETTEP